MVPPLSDEELVNRIRGTPEPDARAFEVLVTRHQAHVLANCRYLTNAAEAEDLAQEVFVKAFFGLGGFEGRSMFKTWLQRIKVNHCVNFIQRRRDQTAALEDPAVAGRPELSVAPAAPQHLENLDRRARIDRVLAQMTESLRVPLLLRELDQLSYQEIADVLGLGGSAVKMRIKRAREEFRRLYNTEGVLVRP